MDWLFFAFIPAILFTVWNLLSRVISVDSKNPRVFSVVYSLVGAIIIFPLFIFQLGSMKQIPLEIILLTGFGTILYGIFDRLQFFASRDIEASTLAILFRITPVATLIASTVFLSEKATLDKILGTLLIIVGNIIIISGPKNFKFNRGFAFALIASIALGLAYTVDKKASAFYPLFVYIFISYFVPPMYNLLIPPLSLNTIKEEVKRASWRIWAMGLVGAGGYCSLIYAFSRADASKVIPISTTSSILTVMAGAIFLKEKSNVLRKIVAILIAFAGVVLIR